jgi:DNA-binding NtrC family response regulator
MMDCTILIVDDEVQVTKNLQIDLEKFLPRCKIITSNYGYSALNRVYCEKINLVVTDIAMPDMNGYELYTRIKEYDATIAVIMITGFGYDPNHILVKTKQSGEVDIFYKPFKTEDMAKLIENKLEDSL